MIREKILQRVNKSVIGCLMRIMYVAPLFVDELPSDFFNGKGEDLIKDISNQAENQIHLTPTFICTSNWF